uniref:Calicivirus coat protein domain-containing protein n=1 Tax=Caliciviridae sp. TaxID=1916234 RepID=A0A8K1N3G2_9CALI|nr:MAG: hypothetical protein [Caliciviridae sp.]
MSDRNSQSNPPHQQSGGGPQPTLIPSEGMVSTGAGSGPIVPLPVGPTEPLDAVSGFTGSVNVLDPAIYEQFVQCPNSSFTVTPNLGEGTLLWSASVSPALNPFTGHLSRMYNAWAGDFEIQVIVAASAMLAGKLVVVLLPPGISAQAVAVSTVTAYPHAIVDVRNSEPTNFPLPDIRNQLFHFREDTVNTSTLAIFVFNPLRAPEGQLFGITGRVLARPLPGFSFSFLVPPSAPVRDISPDWQQLSITGLGDMQSGSRILGRIDSLTIFPQRYQTIPLTWGSIRSNGTYWGWYDGSPTQGFFIRITDTASSAGREIAFVDQNGQDWNIITHPGYIFPPTVPNVGGPGNNDFTYYVVSWSPTTGAITGTGTVCRITISSSPSGAYYPVGVIFGAGGSQIPPAGLYAAVALSPNTVYSDFISIFNPTYQSGPNDTFTLPVTGEAFCMFSHLTPGYGNAVDIYSPLTMSLLEAFATGNFEIPPNNCLLFLVRDRADGTVISEVKLWPGGFFTAPGHGADVTTMLGNDINIEFSSVVPQTYSFSSPAASGAMGRRRAGRPTAL